MGCGLDAAVFRAGGAKERELALLRPLHDDKKPFRRVFIGEIGDMKRKGKRKELGFPTG